MNLEQIHESDVPALSILLSQCKLNSITFHGTNPEKHDMASQMNKSKSVLLKKSLNSTNVNTSDTKSKKKNNSIWKTAH